MIILAAEEILAAQGKPAVFSEVPEWLAALLPKLVAAPMVFTAAEIPTNALALELALDTAALALVAKKKMVNANLTSNSNWEIHE